MWRFIRAFYSFGCCVWIAFDQLTFFFFFQPIQELCWRPLHLLPCNPLPRQVGWCSWFPADLLPAVHNLCLYPLHRWLLRLGHCQLAKEPLPHAAGGHLHPAQHVPSAALGHNWEPHLCQDRARQPPSHLWMVGDRPQDPLHGRPCHGHLMGADRRLRQSDPLLLLCVLPGCSDTPYNEGYGKVCQEVWQGLGNVLRARAVDLHPRNLLDDWGFTIWDVISVLSFSSFY